jgi:hypothetical protein
MVERDLTGEFLWRDVWSYYAEWFCSEEKVVPLPAGMKAKFAEALALHCTRDQVRVWEDGRKRRLTTYRIVARESVQLRTVAA